MYDSSKDTLIHIGRVRHYMTKMITDLLERALNHDKSKTETPEKETYDIYTPLLKEVEYGSERYWETLKEMKPALEHHYQNNSHHPEFYLDKINGMNLLDLVEMVCDWKAAGERHSNSDMVKSIEINAKRFEMDDQLKQILLNTASYLEWI